MGRGKGRWRHIHGVPEEGPISQADQEPLRIGEEKLRAKFDFRIFRIL